MAHPLGFSLAWDPPAAHWIIWIFQSLEICRSSNRTKMGLEIKGLSNWCAYVASKCIIMHIFREKEKKKGWRQSMVNLEVTVEHGWTIYDIPRSQSQLLPWKPIEPPYSTWSRRFRWFSERPTLEVNDDRARRRVHDRIPYPPVIKHG